MLSKEQFEAELSAINIRRGSVSKSAVSFLKNNAPSGVVSKHLNHNRETFDTIGLALSGGGIRSAASCLGAVQALQRAKKFDQIDYLSTVSGGGYLGCCLINGLNNGDFPFVDATDELDLADTDTVRFIRDHTNYLMPAGFSDFLASLGVIFRGLIVSAVLVLGPLLLLAGITSAAMHFAHPLTECLGRFSLTLIWGLIFAACLFFLGINRSRLEAKGTAFNEFDGRVSKIVVLGIAATALLFIVELQPLAISIFENPDRLGKFFGGAISFVTGASKYLAVIVAIVAASASWFVGSAKANEQNKSKSAAIKSIVSKMVLWIAALILPLLLWQLYLFLASLAIPVENPVTFYDQLLSLFDFSSFDQWKWLLFVGAGLALIAVTFLLEANANSLHRLYRDRLGDTFLFSVNSKGEAELQKELLKLSSLKDTAPYLLVNTAVNIQRSSYANRRGRDADFFVFSKHYIGSRATGYAPTEEFETREKSMRLATAMAISGAAASSNMGASALKPLAFTLALLNIRLGYWITNPGLLTKVIDRAGADMRQKSKNAAASSANAPFRFTFNRSFFYLLAEALSNLDETSESVYLTDGGHIENLGLYELLRRRCKLIIVVDAEADPSLNFTSLMAVERYARMDLGTRIDLPWESIRQQYWQRTRDNEVAAREGKALDGAKGFHVAVGKINYSGSPAGKLIYLKSTISGDEDDLVLNYKRKFPDFPHESTTDQFFGEEQFEAYRDLAFHAMSRFLSGKDYAEGLVSKSDDPEDRNDAIDKIFDS
jgi:predicted acylesterase/phospholipase RssA